jgi:hypothetical protein
MYVFTPDMSQLRGGHRLRPGGLATVICQVLAPQIWGWFPTANSSGPGSQMSLFLSLYVNVYAFKKPGPSQASPLPISSPQLTAAAGNYAYVNLWLWEGQTLPWRPATDVISPFSLTLT